MTNRLTMAAIAGVMVFAAGCYKPAVDGGFYNPAVTKYHATQDYDAGDYTSAEQKLNIVLYNDPQDWEAHYLMGLVYLKQNRAIEAQSELEQALAVRDRSESQTPKILDALATSLHDQKRYAELYAFLDAQINRYEGWEDYARKARFLVKANDIDGAALAYRNAAYFSRNETEDIYIELADFYEGLGDYDNALQALKWAYYINDERADLPDRFRKLGVVPGPTLKEQPPQPEYGGPELIKLPKLIGE